MTAPEAPATDSTPPAPADPSGITPEQWGQIIALCGLTPDATAEDVLATITDIVQGEAAAAGQPSAIVAAARKRGLEVLDGELVAKLKRDAAEGRKVLAKAASDHREGIVHAAIARGAITPGRRKHWLALLEADPGMEQVLASTPAETAFSLTERGHGIDGDYSHEGEYTPGAWVK